MSERNTTTKTRRRVGWMAAATLTVGALFAPAAAFADHEIVVADFSLGSGFENPCAQGTTTLKLDEADVQAGTHTYVFGDTGIEIVLTTVFEAGEGNQIDSITVVSITGDAVIYVHAGEGTTLHLVEGMVINPDKGISFVLFCVTPAVVTTTTTDVTTTTDTSGTTTTMTTDTTTTDTSGTTTTTTDTTGTTVTTTDTTGTTVTTTDTAGTTVTTTDTAGTTVTTTDTAGTTVTTTDTAGTTVTSTDTVSGTTSSSSTGSVSGTVGGPAPTLPPTSTDGAQTGTSSTISFALLILAAASLALVMARPLSTRKNDR